MKIAQLIVGLGLVCGLSAFADQSVNLKAGATVTLDKLADTTTVTCEGADTSPRCLCGLNPNATQNKYELKLTQGNVLLDHFLSRADCINAMIAAPECH